MAKSENKVIERLIKMRQAKKARPPAGRKWISWLLVLIGAFYVSLAAVVWLLGDWTWLGTIVLYSPRYLLTWPLLILVALLPLGKWRQRILAGVIVVFGLMAVCQVCVPWERVIIGGGEPIRVLTLNAAHFRNGTQRFEQLLAAVEPDIVLLQENGSESIVWPAEWSVLREGELLIASRFPLRSETVVRRDLPERWPRAIAVFATVTTPAGEFRIGTSHLLSPRAGLSQIVSARTVLDPSQRGRVDQEIAWRRSESSRVASAAAMDDGELILAGDLNMPVESSIYRAHWGDLRNAYSRAGLGFGNTVSVRQGPFRFGARIDHVIFTRHWRCSGCWVGPDVGSDHRPVIADLRHT